MANILKMIKFVKVIRQFFFFTIKVKFHSAPVTLSWFSVSPI
uniref:Uncharacterized protein n=1 Tax=Anguilla anguilla TaxID=7936 RepID=A0A0E9T1L6_ANGAN